jgi:hypothetical protein
MPLLRILVFCALKFSSIFTDLQPTRNCPPHPKCATDVIACQVVGLDRRQPGDKSRQQVRGSDRSSVVVLRGPTGRSVATMGRPVALSKKAVNSPLSPGEGAPIGKAILSFFPGKMACSTRSRRVRFVRSSPPSVVRCGQAGGRHRDRAFAPPDGVQVGADVQALELPTHELADGLSVGTIVAAQGVGVLS